MLHIYILTFILAELQHFALWTLGWGWHPATLESEGKWMTGVCGQPCWQQGTVGLGMWCQFYNMIFRYQLLRAFTLNLIPTGDTAYMWFISLMPNGLSGNEVDENAWGSKFREQWHTLESPLSSKAALTCHYKHGYINFWSFFPSPGIKTNSIHFNYAVVHFRIKWTISGSLFLL